MSELLGPREWSMLLMRAKGLSTAEVAKQHGVGAPHAGNIVRAVVVKLGARDVAHAFAIGLAAGIYLLDDLSDLEIPEHVRQDPPGRHP